MGLEPQSYERTQQRFGQLEKHGGRSPRKDKVELQSGPGVTGEDVIVALCGSFDKDEVLNAAIEFTGEGVNHLSVGRQTHDFEHDDRVWCSGRCLPS